MPAEVVADGERHLAFAEALAAVALTYLGHCRVEAEASSTRSSEQS
jgi:hypothetical protein